MKRLEIKVNLPKGQHLDALVRRFIPQKHFVLYADMEPMNNNDREVIRDVCSALSPLAKSESSFSSLQFTSYQHNTDYRRTDVLFWRIGALLLIEIPDILILMV